MGNWIVQQWLFQYLVKSFMKVHGHPCEQYIFWSLYLIYVQSYKNMLYFDENPLTCQCKKDNWLFVLLGRNMKNSCHQVQWRTSTWTLQSEVSQLFGVCKNMDYTVWYSTNTVLCLYLLLFFPSFFLSKHLNIGTSGNELEVLHNGNCIVLLSASEQKHCTPVIIMRLNEWLKVYTAHLEYPPECCLVIVCLMPYEAVAVLVHILCTHTTKHQFTESLSLKPHT